MIDKYILKACGVIDTLFDKINNFLFAPRCKCKSKKK